MCTTIAVPQSDHFPPLFHRGCIRVACVSVFFFLENVSADNTDACEAVKMSACSRFKSLPAVGWTCCVVNPRVVKMASNSCDDRFALEVDLSDFLLI